MPNKTKKFYDFLQQKSVWVRRETLKIHKIAQGTRLASSLSAVEIFTVLYYGNLIKFDPRNINWNKRDRFIISKGHGAISLYPILADLGFFSKKELNSVCKDGSRLGGIPDPVTPGFETVNGSLGHGLGVACGMAIALKLKKASEKVFILMGDGELYEGSVWEAIMFAGAHRLDNLILIIDNNKVSMLDYCRNIINLEPIEQKFKDFNWFATRLDGHNVKNFYNAIANLKISKVLKPKVIIADTIKGKGVPRLETDCLSHIKSLKAEEIDALLAEVK